MATPGDTLKLSGAQTLVRLLQAEGVPAAFGIVGGKLAPLLHALSQSPIAFVGGLVGIVFTEFAYSLAGAVLISGIVALTFSPMLSSRVLTSNEEPERFELAVEHFFDRLANAYRRLLHNSLNWRPVTYVFAAIMVVSIYFMFISSTNELTPTEDREVLNVQIKGPETATLEYATTYVREVVNAYESIPEYLRSFVLIGGGGSPATSFGGVRFLPVAERERTQAQLHAELQQKVSKIAGVQVAVFSFPSLPVLRKVRLYSLSLLPIRTSTSSMLLLAK